MKRRKPKAPPKPPNLAAKALGQKIFGQKVLTPKKGYTRKIKHRPAPGSPEDEDGFPLARE